MTDAPRLLSEPSEPVPPVVVDAAALAACVEALRQGSGLLAVDTERAGGHRYSQRAYLLQFRRAGSGTWLIDPISAAADDGGFEALAEVINPLTWVLHSAGGDLPALAELGLAPTELFDSELAGRLLGEERVGLSAMLATHLGVTLAKSHSAADWSRRPLPPAWLHYAALDVELLLELAADVSRELIETGRDVWAAQEFEFVRTSPPPAPDPQRWRKVKKLRTRAPRGLAVARALWFSRDELARELDRTPSRLLPDSAISALATAAVGPQPPTSVTALKQVPGMADQPAARRRRWLAAMQEALELPASELPPERVRSPGPPDPRNWARIDPELATRFESVRARLTAQAEELGLPRENLLSPRVVKTVVWDFAGPDTAAKDRLPPSPDDVATALAAQGARPWQVELTAPEVAAGLAEKPTPDAAE